MTNYASDYENDTGAATEAPPTDFRAAPRDAPEYAPPGWRQAPEERTEIEPTPDYPVRDDIVSAPTGEMEPDPLLVAVVSQPDAHESRDWSANQFYIDETRPVMLVGAEYARRRVVIINNDDTNAVRLLARPTDALFTGVLLGAGQQVEMLHNGAVWAQCEATLTAYVSVISEYVLRDE